MPTFGNISPIPPSSSHLDDSNFHDDEPLPVASTLPSGNDKVAVKTFTEFPAIAASDSISSFAVLINVCGPPLAFGDGQSRVPVDLVFVLDVSGSMRGTKLHLLKSASRFVIDHMLPCDRLSIVTFSTNARRILPLRKMTQEGRQDAKMAVDQLSVENLTNIVAGLNMGAKVLEERRMFNPVSSIILVSDGQDTVNGGGRGRGNRTPPEYLNLLVPSIFCVNRDTFGGNENHGQRFPVHAFGVGMDHDSVAMNAISDASDGTFSFLESPEIIPTSFARCIGGLFSVVAQDVRLMVLSASPGVEIKHIPSGRHESEINSQKKQGVIHIGDLYAEEKKDFLVHVSVPVYSEAQMEETGVVGKTPLLDIVCYYRDPLSNETEQIEVESVEILRPTTALSSADGAVNLEVDRQKNRVRVAESIEKAKEMAEKGNMKDAQEVLTNSRTTLLASASAHSGDDLINQLEAELRETTARMANVDLYERAGRPLVLAGLSAHRSQRATTLSHTNRQAAFGASRVAGFAGPVRQKSIAPDSFAACAAAPSAYDTPMMQMMVSKIEAPEKGSGDSSAEKTRTGG